jgi:hypothetical protein
VQEEMMCSMVSPSVPQILHLSMIDCNPHMCFNYLFYLGLSKGLQTLFTSLPINFMFFGRTPRDT